jgi:hypothetical protein
LSIPLKIWGFSEEKIVKKEHEKQIRKTPLHNKRLAPPFQKEMPPPLIGSAITKAALPGESGLFHIMQKIRPG